MKKGDLVKIVKHGAIGVVTEIFDDLDPKDPWIRVVFMYPAQTYQWCRQSGLRIAKGETQKDLPLSGAV